VNDSFVERIARVFCVPAELLKEHERSSSMDRQTRKRAEAEFLRAFYRGETVWIHPHALNASCGERCVKRQLVSGQLSLFDQGGFVLETVPLSLEQLRAIVVLVVEGAKLAEQVLAT
jgi:hypothetical protein